MWSGGWTLRKSGTILPEITEKKKEHFFGEARLSKKKGGREARSTGKVISHGGNLPVGKNRLVRGNGRLNYAPCGRLIIRKKGTGKRLGKGERPRPGRFS